jgi:hypothetical protein
MAADWWLKFGRFREFGPKTQPPGANRMPTGGGSMACGPVAADPMRPRRPRALKQVAF